MFGSKQATASCPNDDVFAAFITGDLDPASRTSIETHFDGCAACRELVAELTRAENPQPETSSTETIGRFELRGTLGAGAMGVVYRAHDPMLRREVAVKVLRRDDDGGDEEASARMMREARTMARLSHPNVITVFEVGLWDDSVFIAMEYVDGFTLREWLDEEDRSWRHILDVLCRAGAGLAAAHDAGLIHRDFKPDNVLIGRDQRVRVTDFGLARPDLVADDSPDPDDPQSTVPSTLRFITMTGALIGTPAYMSPEQHLGQSVTFASDQFSFCLALFESLYGYRAFRGNNYIELRRAILEDEPSAPPIDTPVPPELHSILIRGLRRQPEDRFDSMAALLEELALYSNPERRVRQLEEGESPFPGLTPFQEADADRFFGRTRELQQLLSRMRDTAMVGIVGPSGVGKSSFVRAGLIPALADEGWLTLTLRPGHDPLGALARMVLPLARVNIDGDADSFSVLGMAARIAADPMSLAKTLSAHAKENHKQILVFVDQFEELYTLVPDPVTRAAFTSCLMAIARGSQYPTRVVVSMRSDLLDRVSEDRTFLDQLSRGLMFLPPPDRRSLEEALTHPVEIVGYSFESPRLVARMVDELEDTPGALPLLQFAAEKLWHDRDRQRHLLTEASYEAIGAVAGALASHANSFVAGLTSASRSLARTIFRRLVTQDRTRDIVSIAELAEGAVEPEEVTKLIDRLVEARLVIVQQRDDGSGATVELVHESLITSWPTLQKWLDEDQEDAAFLAELRTAAKQWENRDYDQGLLWRGDTMEEARRWFRRYDGPLLIRDRRFLEEVFHVANRATRRRRAVVAMAFALLLALVGAAAVALLWIRAAEVEATNQAVVAERAARQAKAAESALSKQVDLLTKKEEERLEAEQRASKAGAKVVASEVKLQQTNEELRSALSRAEGESRRAAAAARKAQEAASAERAAKERLERLLDAERRRVQKLREKRKTITNTLE